MGPSTSYSSTSDALYRSTLELRHMSFERSFVYNASTPYRAMRKPLVTTQTFRQSNAAEQELLKKTLDGHAKETTYYQQWWKDPKNAELRSRQGEQRQGPTLSEMVVEKRGEYENLQSSAFSEFVVDMLIDDAIGKVLVFVLKGMIKSYSQK